MEHMNTVDISLLKQIEEQFTGIDREYEEVKKFQKAFGHPWSDEPKPMDTQRAVVRTKWMCEEVREFSKAVRDCDLVGQADAMIDLIYFALGTLVEIGVKPQKLFDIVQKANMSKLWEDGKPRYKEDGKIKKPANWQPPEPELVEEITRQIVSYEQRDYSERDE
jgi:predicted HAD superfamily Cof-like phosphohydrolase